MLPFKISNAATMRPGMVRSLPPRSIRARATVSGENAIDAVTSSAQEAMDNVATKAVPAGPELLKTATPAPSQPVTPDIPNGQAQSISEFPSAEAPISADGLKPSFPDMSGKAKLDMSDILPDVKAPEVEASVADKVESIFSKVFPASNMFQKMQPEVQSATAPDNAAPSPESPITKVTEMLDSIKEATTEMAKAPTPKAESPILPFPSTSTAAPPAPPQAPSIDTVVPDAPTIQEVVQDAAKAAKAAADAITASVGIPTGAVSSAASEATEPVGPGPVTRAIEYTDAMMDRAEGAVGSFIDSAAGQATNLMQNVGEGVYNTMPKSLPPNLQPKADVIGENIAAAKAIYDDAPGVYLLLAVLAIGSSAYAYWKFEYGGYRGVFTPVDLLEALNREENVFVVDIRPDEDLKQKGILDLKRRARGKATHLPLVDVPDAVKGNIENSQRLQLQLNAALVTSLNEVNRFTKIVVMDSRGTSVKGLARAITDQGYRGYMLSGGFSEWKTGGLAVKSGSYAVTPADLLADKGEELSEAAEQTAEKLRQPRNAAIALLTLASAVAVYLYPHESFRLIGVLGIELTILVKLLSYESPSAAVDDVTKGFRSIKDSFSSATAQAAEFAEVAQARSASELQPPVLDKPAETQQKSSPVSEARESVAAEAVKEAQAALERMVAQSKETKPPPVPAPQASAKAAEKKAPSGKPFVSADEDGKPAAPQTANPKSGTAPADSKPSAPSPADRKAAVGVVGSSTSGDSKTATSQPAKNNPSTSAAVSNRTAATASAATKTQETKPEDRKSAASRLDKNVSIASAAGSKPETEARSANWPASEKKDETVPPKPIVDSLPYVSPEGKARKGKEGKGGAKPATNKK